MCAPRDRVVGRACVSALVPLRMKVRFDREEGAHVAAPSVVETYEILPGQTQGSASSLPRSKLLGEGKYDSQKNKISSAGLADLDVQHTRRSWLQS